ncbi:MAG: hypothetical protein LBP21_06275 [Synergistaceae bacterium]|jgi:hypothetical protein|nr:hypothetical protein [Synergistaceae bacterium]
MSAYREIYLNNAADVFGSMMEYVVNDCQLDPDVFLDMFVSSGLARQFEQGSPRVVAGKSGIELAREVILSTTGKEPSALPGDRNFRTPDYWAGWPLAQYQWRTARTFAAILRALPFTEIVKTYPTLHEADITKFFAAAGTRCGYVKSKKCPQRAYALSSTMALVFLLTVLLGVVVAHIGYSSDVMGVYLKRVQARAELTSMTNSALKRLTAEFSSGARPRADGVAAYEKLTDLSSLSIFSSCSVSDSMEKMESRVEVFDLDYDPENLAEPVTAPLLLPPSLPGGYMIRATVAHEGLASLMTESVYMSVCIDIPEVGEVYILEKKPVYWKESFR